MAWVDWQSSGVSPTMQGRPLITHERLELSQLSCVQSVSTRQEQNAWMPVSPVPRHCGTHWRLAGSQTAPTSGGSALSQSSLTMPAVRPG